MAESCCRCARTRARWAGRSGQPLGKSLQQVGQRRRASICCLVICLLTASFEIPKSFATAAIVSPGLLSRIFTARTERACRGRRGLIRHLLFESRPGSSHARVVGGAPGSIRNTLIPYRLLRQTSLLSAVGWGVASWWCAFGLSPSQRVRGGEHRWVGWPFRLVDLHFCRLC